jgi:hypothetical protein
VSGFTAPSSEFCHKRAKSKANGRGSATNQTEETMKTAAIAATLAAAMTASLVGVTDASAMAKIRVYSDLQIGVKSAAYAPAQLASSYCAAQGYALVYAFSYRRFESHANAEGSAVFNTIQCTSDKVAR